MARLHRGVQSPGDRRVHGTAGGKHPSVAVSGKAKVRGTDGRALRRYFWSNEMTSHCEHEQSVLESLRSGTLHRGLPEHLERCEICQEVVFAAKCLQDEIAPTVATVHLPD